MPTLHWFCSLGTARSAANYVLTEALARRLEAVFPQAGAPGSWVSGPADASPRVAVSQSVTGGLLALFGPTGPDWTVRIHLVTTPETGAAEAHFWADLAAARSAGCDWEKGGTETCARRDPEGLATVLSFMLDAGRGFAPGDAVFVEATSGLRPIAIALQLGFSVVENTVPGLAFASASYGELGLWPEPDAPELVRGAALATFREKKVALSPIFDLTDLVKLPAWATAAADLTDRLDVRRLSTLVRAEGPGLREQADLLKRLQDAYALVHVQDMVPLLRALLAHLEARDATSDAGRTVAVRALLQRVLRERIQRLTVHLPDAPADATLDAVRFQLAVAGSLRDGHRAGDCLRMLREALVTRMQVALMTDPAARADRHAAEQRFRRAVPALQALWDRVRAFRNATSHAGTGAAAAAVDSQAVVQSLWGTEAGAVDLVAEVTAACIEHVDWWALGDAGAADPTILWLDPPEDAAGAACSKAVRDAQTQALGALLACDAGALRWDAAPDPWRPPIPGKPATAVGKRWGADKTRKLLKTWPGLLAVVFVNPQRGWGHRRALVTALRDEAVLSYAWHPGDGEAPDVRVPLLDRGEEQWVREQQRG